MMMYAAMPEDQGNLMTNKTLNTTLCVMMLLLCVTFPLPTEVSMISLFFTFFVSSLMFYQVWIDDENADFLMKFVKFCAAGVIIPVLIVLLTRISLRNGTLDESTVNALLVCVLVGFVAMVLCFCAFGYRTLTCLRVQPGIGGAIQRASWLLVSVFMTLLVSGFVLFYGAYGIISASLSGVNPSTAVIVTSGAVVAVEGQEASVMISGNRYSWSCGRDMTQLYVNGDPAPGRIGHDDDVVLKRLCELSSSTRGRVVR